MAHIIFKQFMQTLTGKSTKSHILRLLLLAFLVFAGVMAYQKAVVAEECGVECTPDCPQNC